ncbi:response regulator [Domibacillus sp. A3M-37]|uniref:response regulator n=1 Tax=Domibacillus sp. A3M-37 TaxID=2962037 RepID=UPI0020B75668|nr:response regulator [Domibacillus sp. A3M-37]MCP3763487.1 response regulator [Domibacillus sp. A3M-37]
MEAWKVLIADDEPMIREGLRDSIDWPQLGMEVAAEAEDGEEALELAIEHDIHVLLADLNMPIMNGIDMIRALKEQKPDCQVIIITGHDEFTYAQEALRMNVTDYILKPVKPEQLREVVTRVRDKLEETRKEAARIQRMNTQIIKNELALKETFGRDWIAGIMEKEEIIAQLDFFRLSSGTPAEIGIIRSQAYRSGKPLLTENDRRMMLFAVKNIAEDWLKETEHLLFSNEEHVVLITWVPLSDKLIRAIEETLKQYMNIHSQFYRENVIEHVACSYKKCRERAEQDAAASPIVRRAKEYINQHFENPGLSLESTAEALQVSPVYLSRIIKQELGISFVQLVTGKRMNKAVHLLETTDLTILNIAEAVGFESQHYFSTAFKKAVGVSPNQYRKKSFS